MQRLRRLFLALCLLPLSGCGFEPLYATKPKDDVSKVFAGVKIDPIPGRQGQLLRAALEDRLNPRGDIPVKPQYRLSLTMNNSVVPIGVARDGTVSRFNLYITTNYTLYHIDNDTPITAGTLSYVNSFNNRTNEYFSTYVSEQDAIKRNVTEISELYRLRLTGYLNEGAIPEDPKQIAAKPRPSAYTPVLINQIPGISNPQPSFPSQ